MSQIEDMKVTSFSPSLFFLSMGTFLYYVILFPTVSVLLESSYLFVVFGFAPIGLAIGSLFGRFPIFPVERLSPALLGAFTAGSILLAFVFMSELKEFQYLGFPFPEIETSQQFYEFINARVTRHLFVIAGLTSLPFVFLGMAIVSILQKKGGRYLNRKLFSEMLGAALGSLVGPLWLDFMGYKETVMLSIFCIFVGVLLVADRFRPFSIGLIAAVIATLIYLPETAIEPTPNVAVVGRDFKNVDPKKELWSSWTTYGRVTLFADVAGRYPGRFVGLNNGECLAGVPTKRRAAREDLGAASKIALSFGKPQSMLILFSGVGKDAAFAKHTRPDLEKIVGVELNPKMFEIDSLIEDIDLSDYFHSSHMLTVQDAARVFLETSKESFDVVLFSHSGASVAHYLGTIGHTAQYNYTSEGLEAALERLSPSGHLVIMNTNKLNILMALRGLLKDQLKESVVLLSKKGRVSWKRVWDDDRLLVKPSGFSENDVEEIRRNVAGLGYQVVLAPRDFYERDFTPHREIVSNRDWKNYRDELFEKTGFFFQSYFDDRPFVFNVLPVPQFFSLEFWKAELMKLTRGEALKSRFLFFVIILLASVLLFVVASVDLSSRAGSSPLPGDLMTLLFLGFAFFLFEIIFIQKLSLFLGSPTHAMAFGAGLILLGSSFGCLLYQKEFSIKVDLFFVLAAPLIFWLVSVGSSEFLFSLSTGGRVALLAIPALALGFSSSRFYAAALKRVQDGRFRGLGYGLALNTLGSALAITLGPMVIEFYGVTIALILSWTAYVLAYFLTALLSVNVSPLGVRD